MEKNEAADSVRGMAVEVADEMNPEILLNRLIVTDLG